MEIKQKAIIAGVHLRDEESAAQFDNAMQELRNLAIACELEVVGEVQQKANHVNPKHYIGKGKLDELRMLLQVEQAELVIFNDELSASQIRNVEKILQKHDDKAENPEQVVRVIDRTVLILDIFGQRARTREAKLQVEIASLQYEMPRLIGFGEVLSRQGGSAGPKNRGAGETKLELDRRKIETRISKLNKELEMLVAQRKNQRVKRKKQGIPVVALVGYTNAGKSSLLNRLLSVEPQEKTDNNTAKFVFEKDMLFATLETAVRRVKLADNKQFLLTDTVGFISKLPHNLVKAFRSTLEEVTEADLLIHVVDYANPEHEQQIEVTIDTLRALGADKIPVLFAYNKIDLLGEKLAEELVKRTDKAININNEYHAIYLSAASGLGIEHLATAIRQLLFLDYVNCKMIFPYTSGHLVTYFTENAHIINLEYLEEGTLLELECSEKDYLKYRDYSV